MRNSVMFVHHSAFNVRACVGYSLEWKCDDNQNNVILIWYNNINMIKI